MAALVPVPAVVVVRVSVVSVRLVAVVVVPVPAAAVLPVSALELQVVALVSVVVEQVELL